MYGKNYIALYKVIVNDQNGIISFFRKLVN